MFNQIINPSNNKSYSIYSKQGKKLLKQYVKMYIGGADESPRSIMEPIGEEEDGGPPQVPVLEPQTVIHGGANQQPPQPPPQPQQPPQPPPQPQQAPQPQIDNMAEYDACRENCNEQHPHIGIGALHWVNCLQDCYNRSHDDLQQEINQNDQQ